MWSQQSTCTQERACAAHTHSCCGPQGYVGLMLQQPGCSPCLMAAAKAASVASSLATVLLSSSTCSRLAPARAATCGGSGTVAQQRGLAAHVAGVDLQGARCMGARLLLWCQWCWLHEAGMWLQVASCHGKAVKDVPGRLCWCSWGAAHAMCAGHSRVRACGSPVPACS